eukprot:TRINITY_DN3530_c0_g1_i3.p1 TRINITY_DN3530_c0_g1~~TRINITY_DN3530_c0_g1_i3.p1  ORF type:complete len:133 (-),score=29.01 TRINITY_DN3530_c0_g1_i3:52-450(-)
MTSYLAAFITGAEANAQLQNEPIGTFLIRLSERMNGELVISYSHQSGIRHYLLQPDDTADKKKTLIDFLGHNPLFVELLQLSTNSNGKRVWNKHNKDVVLQKYYKKPPNAEAKNLSSEGLPYDTRLPLSNAF